MLRNHRRRNLAQGTCTSHRRSSKVSFTYYFFTFNMTCAFFRSYAEDDVSMMAFIVFIFLSFLVLDGSLKAFHRLPRREKSPRKEALKHAIWISFSAIIFGFAFQFAPLINKVLVFGIAVMTSACLFYGYVVDDGVNGSCLCCGNDEENKFFMLV